ncbi:MAG: YbjN domain-containing protein [Spirochaetes bacterium]|nr:YbjN domain-containing protein [Spirochaetota bacterium]MBU1081780.1 YbjN domain-containing protein [Spirochaetota bacterium]
MTKIESYLMDLDISYEEVSPTAFFIDDQAKGLPGITITLDDPIVVVRARVMPAPRDKREELFATLLRLNGTDMVHGAYGLDADDVVLIDTLEYETMDKQEFEAALDSIGLALSRHYGVLGSFRG